jgi:hypothetical protein
MLMTSPQESFRSFASDAAASAPEPMGPALGKISIIWAGFFAGITLGDLVLFATLVYTILQTCLLVYERIVKPLMLARATRMATDMNRADRAERAEQQTNHPQEK